MLSHSVRSGKASSLDTAAASPSIQSPPTIWHCLVRKYQLSEIQNNVVYGIFEIEKLPSQASQTPFCLAVALFPLALNMPAV